MYHFASDVGVFHNPSLAERLQRLIGCQARATFPSRRDRGPIARRGAVPRGDLFDYPLNPPLQIRTLLSDCLTDEEQGSMSGRNPLASINEVLREGKFGRDRSKVLPSSSITRN